MGPYPFINSTQLEIDFDLLPLNHLNLKFKYLNEGFVSSRKEENILRTLN